MREFLSRYFGLALEAVDLRAVGIHGERVVKGYRIELTEPVRQQIHRMARAYHVLSAQDGVARCSQCSNVEEQKRD